MPAKRQADTMSPAVRASEPKGDDVPQPAHLRVYRFDPGTVFEGGLLAAIEASS